MLACSSNSMIQVDRQSDEMKEHDKKQVFMVKSYEDLSFEKLHLSSYDNDTVFFMLLARPIFKYQER